MRSTTRKVSIFCVIFTAISFIAAAMVTVALQSVELSFGMKFAIIVYLFAISLVSLLLTVSLRSLCQDLDLEYETTATRIRDHNIRIAKLEENEIN